MMHQPKTMPKAMIFFSPSSRIIAEYLTVKEPSLQDFKSTSQYHFALFKINSQSKLYGVEITDANLLEKIFFTF